MSQGVIAEVNNKGAVVRVDIGSSTGLLMEVGAPGTIVRVEVSSGTAGYLAIPAETQGRGAILAGPQIINQGVTSVNGDTGPVVVLQSQVITRVCAISISALRVVSSNSSGELIYTDITDIDQATSSIGITKQAGAPNASIEVVVSGLLTDSSWNWVPGKPIFLSGLGTLSQFIPTGAFLQEVARALSPTEIFVQIYPPTIR